MKKLLFICIICASCKPSNKYSTESLYPTPTIAAAISTILPVSEQVQEAVLQPFFDDYHNLKAANFLSNDRIVYYKLKDLSVYGSVLGRCETYDNANIVYIDPVFFAGANNLDIHSVVYHEMGHCDLGRIHRTLYWQGTFASYDGNMIPNWGNQLQYLADGVTANPNFRGNWPLSLMHRSIVRSAKFSVEYNYYIQELFHVSLYANNSFAPGNDSNNCSARLELDGNIHFE